MEWSSYLEQEFFTHLKIYNDCASNDFGGLRVKLELCKMCKETISSNCQSVTGVIFCD